MESPRKRPRRPCNAAAAAACLAAAAMAVAMSAAMASSVAVYVNDRGDRLITSRPVDGTQWRLARRYPDRDSPGSASASAGAGRYAAMIDRAADDHGLDPALLKAVVHAESNFDPLAVSSRGAVGLMQLMPETASQYGVRDRNDAGENLSAGARHLRELLRRHRSLSLALAAYNAGDQAVARYGGVPPFPETRAYIARVLELASRYRQQDHPDS